MKKTFSKIISDGEVLFKHAKGERDIIGKEMHGFHEIFILLGGDADFITENGREKMLPYTVAVIPKGCFHQFVVFSDECDYHRAVLQFDDGALGSSPLKKRLSNAYTVYSNELKDLFLRLIALCEQRREKEEANMLLRAFLIEATVYLPKDSERGATASTFHPATYDAIDYIEANLSAPMTVETIAGALNVSESYLAHVFKKDMNIPIHKYILEKKLVTANARIKNGARATEVAEALGFGDYSGFYRQYKKMFGLPPSKSKI